MRFIKSWAINSIFMFAVLWLIAACAIVLICFVAWDLPAPGFAERMIIPTRVMILVAVAFGFFLTAKEHDRL